MIALPLTGRCQCGAVRYEITAPPLTVYACHCTDCQKQSGGAFALSLLVPRDGVRITAGSAAEWLRPAEHAASGTPTLCLFCGACGNRLYHLPTRNKAVAVVKPGTLDEAGWLDPVGHIWTSSRQSWFPLAEDSLCYAEAPPDFAALSAAFANRHRA
jgi:hypothetical protein